MASPRNIRISSPIPFPALVVGGAPITVTKVNGIWTIALNMGNDGNKAKLLAGYGWTEAQVMAELNKFMTKEDWDLAQRIKASGGKVWFSPELRVIYWPRGRVSKLVRQFYSTGVWRGDLTRRDPARASRRYFVPPLAVVAIVAGMVLLALGLNVGVIPATAYLMVVALVAATASGLSLKARVALVVALVVMHMSWGWGFLVGYARGARGTVDRSRVTGSKEAK